MMRASNNNVCLENKYTECIGFGLFLYSNWGQWPENFGLIDKKW